MNKIKVFATIAAVSALMFAGTLPASAHTGDAAPVVVCQIDGTYTVTWTYKQTNTPSSGQGSQSDVKVISHSAGTLESAADNKVSAPQIFLNEAVDHAANDKSNQHRLGNFEQTFTQSGIPGTATSASVGIQTDWLGWGATETDRTVTLPGDCKPPVVNPPVVTPPVTEPPATNPPVTEQPNPTPTPSETPLAAPETPQEPDQAPPTEEVEELAHTGVDATPFLLGAGALLLVGAVLLRWGKHKKRVAE